MTRDSIEQRIARYTAEMHLHRERTRICEALVDELKTLLDGAAEPSPKRKRAASQKPHYGFGRPKLTPEERAAVLADLAVDHEYGSLSRIGRKYGVTAGAIQSIARRATNGAAGAPVTTEATADAS